MAVLHRQKTRVELVELLRRLDPAHYHNMIKASEGKPISIHNIDKDEDNKRGHVYQLSFLGLQSGVMVRLSILDEEKKPHELHVFSIPHKHLLYHE